MESIRSLYKIGNGPSSSHTMGPRKAAEIFLERNPGASSFEVTLYGALAATGKGHLTDVAILDTLQSKAPATIVWQPEIVLPFHTNGMKFRALDQHGTELSSWTVYSVGGGDLLEEGQSREAGESIYGMTKIKDIQRWCEETGRSYWEYVDQCEGSGIWDYLAEVWQVMKEAVERGLEAEGVLPGGLGVRRKAVSYYVHASGYNSSLKSRGLVYAYALAVSEENAAGGRIVTAPTCGSCGIVPAVLYHLHTSKNFTEKRILRALDANLYAAISDGRHSVDFDRIVEVMKQTGHDIPSLYKETAQGGLAVIK